MLDKYKLTFKKLSRLAIHAKNISPVQVKKKIQCQ